MFDIVENAFSYERNLIVYSFLQDISKRKGSSLQLYALHILRFYLVGQTCINALRARKENVEKKWPYPKFARVLIFPPSEILNQHLNPPNKKVYTGFYSRAMIKFLEVVFKSFRRILSFSSCITKMHSMFPFYVNRTSVYHVSMTSSLYLALL